MIISFFYSIVKTLNKNIRALNVLFSAFEVKLELKLLIYL
uniref:Uncharacterized protein n=1 Tax=Borrelia turicatae (strain 91E135) TaxID=314724 RepID=A0A0R9PUI7_BORT9|nr:hypothetical protein BTA096a [Borrelia turicatae 91E135]